MTERSTATDVIMELSRENLSLRRDVERYEKWKEAVDRELVISLQCTTDSYEDPHKAVSDLIDWHIEVAIDPRCNGGWELVKVDEDATLRYSDNAFNNAVKHSRNKFGEAYHMMANGWKKHVGAEKPNDLAPAQIAEYLLEVECGTGLEPLVRRAEKVDWAIAPMLYRPVFDTEGLPYVSAEGLEEWVEYVAHCQHEGVIHASSRIEWYGDGWRPVTGCTFAIKKSETHRIPGLPENSLARVWRENS